MSLRGILDCSIPDRPGYWAPNARAPIEEPLVPTLGVPKAAMREWSAGRRSRELGLRERRVIEHVRAHPGVSSLGVAMGLGVSVQAASAALQALVARGDLVRTDGARGVGVFNVRGGA